MNTSDNQAQLAQVAAKIVGETIRASGTRLFISEVVKELINEWAQKGGIRGRFASAANWIVLKVLKPEKNGSGRGISADVGRLITIWARKVNADHAIDPLCHAGTTGDTIHNFLKNTDFGEIREMVESSDPCILKTVEAFNEQLWKYPAKVGSLVATVIPLLNTLMRVFREILMPIEKSIGPDLFADIMLSVVKGINGADTARLINTLQEVLRRLHTGSLLLGKGGKPLMQTYLTDVLKACLPEMNPELLRKACIILAEDKLSIANSVADALTDNPEITLSYLASMGSVKSSAVKANVRKLRVYEDLSQDGLKAALSESLSDLDTYEIAELINSACRILNRIHAGKPNFVLSLSSGVVDSLGTQEIAETAQWLIPDLVQAFKPLAPAIMPVFIKGLSEMLSQDGGYDTAEQAEAIQTLRATVARAAGGEK